MEKTVFRRENRGDDAVKVEMDATVPHDRNETNVVELPPPPGYV